MNRFLLIAVGLSVVLAGCHEGEHSAYGHHAETDQHRLTPEKIAESVVAAMDRSADPCEDFYQYACGSWLGSTERPSDQSRWTRSFSVVTERNRQVVREILEEAAADPGEDPDRRRIGLYYGACMDEAAVEQAANAPLAEAFELIETVEDTESLFKVAGQLHRWSTEVLFDVEVIPDFADPNLNIAFFFQGGLGMPDRDYYVSEDETKRQLLTDYEAHIARMFTLIGEDDAAATKHAREIVELETRFAEVSRDRTQMRMLEKLYNKLDIGGLKELTPALPWDVYLSAIGYPGVQQISVATPEFFEALETLVAETPTDELQTYLRWHLLSSKAPLLTAALVAEDFAFYGTKLNGQEEIKPRWKRCVAATENALGEAIGKLYVERMFAGASKEIALEMIKDIKNSFEATLPDLSWMDPTTRTRAIEKLNAMGFKIGYPDEWRDYSTIRIAEGEFYANALAAEEFEYDRQSRKIDKPVDREEWLMTPQMVNAYNHPLFNEMGYPAGILQPPFFHRDFPAAMNYGGIGGGIGHELTHGFDDQGRKFNPRGQMEEWWEPNVSEQFESRARCVDDFYSNYEVEPGAPVNGKLTLGENIADLGGLKASYAGYKAWEERHGTPEPIVDGLTNDQLLFVAWGQVWCTLQTPEQARLQVTTDPHSPARFRVNGPVSHNPGFARAFACEPSTGMNPADQCVVW